MKALAVALIAPSVALASIPAPDGTYTACINKHLGIVRLIDPSRESCGHHFERMVTWSRGGSSESVVAIPIGQGDLMCPYGGTKFVVQGLETYACNGAPGMQGPQGPKGDTGAAGPQGPAGSMGPQGPMGLPGPQGPVGVAGPAGVQGPAGPTGSQGVTGAQGPKGDRGESGLQGPAGPQGPAGQPVTTTQLAVGDQNCPYGGVAVGSASGTSYVCNGAKGETGAAGLQGIPGPAGAQGPMGLAGPMGPAGVDGLPGLPGAQGPAGPTGSQGPAGAQGPKGDTGEAGPQGPAGPTGPVGPAGQSLTAAQLARGDPNCPFGGVAIGSASGTTYICGADQGQPPLVDAAAIAQINQWANLSSGTAWTLCFKATRDAMNWFAGNAGAAGFHGRCDNRGRTFFVARTSLGRLFGGYTSLPWGATSCGYKADTTAFLFSLTNSYKHTLAGASTYSVYDCSSSGPTFGGGYDFTTNLRDSASANLGYTYACRVGTYGSSDCRNDFAGAFQPALAELEVYSQQ